MSEQDNNNVLPDDENNHIEEASAQKMPVGTEEESIASVAKTDDGIKRQPKRKGDKDGKDEPAPQGGGKSKSKAGKINAMYSKMSGMKKEDLDALYDSMISEDEDFSEDDDEELEESSYDFTDDLNALVESEATLSDEFKAKTSVIFETAINSKISEEIERLEENYQERLETEINETRDEMVEKVDSYLNYVVENWMKENELAVEAGLRTEIAEDFMTSLKDLFVESYIEVPESKVDLVDSLAEQVEELEETLNETTGSLLEQQATLEQYQRDAIIRENSRDLADTQIEKLNKLVESLDFEDKESFTDKVKTVKESYFKKEINEDTDETDDSWEDDTVEVSSSMSHYLDAIKKTSK